MIKRVKAKKKKKKKDDEGGDGENLFKDLIGNIFG